MAFCEIDKFCQKVLKKHWPDTEIIDDVRSERTKQFRDIDLLTAGFPCQDISHAGQWAGITGPRSGLWSRLCEIIGEIRPKIALVENVSNLLAGERGAWFGVVLSDLAQVGYDAEWHCLPAAYLGFPHIRDRVWILAHPASQRWKISLCKKTLNSAQKSLQAHIESGYKWRRKNGGHSLDCVGWSVEPELRGGNDGIPSKLDKHRITALGNSIVPQCAMIIMQAIKDCEATVCLSQVKDYSRRKG